MKKEQVLSETKRKIFSGEDKAEVALEALHGVQTANKIGREFGGASDTSGAVEKGAA